MDLSNINIDRFSGEPKDPQIVGFCTICECNLYDGQWVEIDGELYCEECLEILADLED